MKTAELFVQEQVDLLTKLLLYSVLSNFFCQRLKFVACVRHKPRGVPCSLRRQFWSETSGGCRTNVLYCFSLAGENLFIDDSTGVNTVNVTSANNAVNFSARKTFILYFCSDRHHRFIYKKRHSQKLSNDIHVKGCMLLFPWLSFALSPEKKMSKVKCHRISVLHQIIQKLPSVRMSVESCARVVLQSKFVQIVMFPFAFC